MPFRHELSIFFSRVNVGLTKQTACSAAAAAEAAGGGMEGWAYVSYLVGLPHGISTLEQHHLRAHNRISRVDGYGLNGRDFAEVLTY